MKVQLETGGQAILLNSKELRTLNAAWEILEQIAFHQRATEACKSTSAACDTIQGILATAREAE